MTAETKTRHPSKRRFSSWQIILIGISLAVLVTFVAIRWAARTGIARGFAESKIESLNIQGQTIDLDGFRGDLLGKFSIEQITLSDTEGIWAELHDVHFGWSPAKLLGRELQLNEISIGKLHVLRRPEITNQPKSAKSTSNGAGNPLIKIVLKEFVLSEFMLEQGVTPRFVSGRANACFEWSRSETKLDVEVSPDIENGDQLIGHIAWSDKTPINGTFRMIGPEGGLFATLLQLEPEQKLKADFSVSGVPDRLSGQGAAEIDDNKWVTLDIVPDADNYLISVDIDLTQHSATREQIASLGETVSLEALWRNDGQNGGALQRVEANTESLQLTLDDIVLEGDQNRAKLNFELIKPAMLIPVEAVTVENAVLTGDVFSENGVYGFEGQFFSRNLNRKEVGTTTLSGPILVYLEEQKLSAEVSLKGENIRLQFNDEPRNFSTANLNTSLQFDLANETFAIQSAAISLGKTSLNMSGSGSLFSGSNVQMTGSGNINLPDLGLYDTGTLQADWKVSGEEKGIYQFTLAMTGKALAGNDETAKLWLGNSSALTLKGRLSTDQTFVIQTLKLDTPALLILGNGQYARDGSVRLNTEMTSKQGYPLESLAPDLKATVTASGKSDDLTLAALISSPEIKAGPGLQNAEFGFNGNWNGSSLSGKTFISSMLEEEPLRFDTPVYFADGNWSLSDLAGNWRELTLTGQVAGSGSDFASLNSQILLTGNLPESVPARSLDAQLELMGENVSLYGTLQDISSGAFIDGNVTFDISGTKSTFSYSINAEGLTQIGPGQKATQLSLNGDVSLQDDNATTVTGTLNAMIGEHKISTVHPFHLSTGNSGLSGDMQLSAFGGTVTAELVNGGATPLSASISDLDIVSLSEFLGNPASSGTLNADLVLSAESGVANASLNGRVSNLSSANVKADPVSFEFTGYTTPDETTLKLYAPEAQMLQVKMDVLLGLGAQPVAPFFVYANPEVGHFELSLDGPVDNAAALLMPESMVIKGVIGANISAELKDLVGSLNGALSFENGIFQHETLGTDLENINFNISVSDQNLIVQSFSAMGRKGGTLSGSGNVSFLADGDSTLAIKADRLVAINRREAKAIVSGTLGLDLSGDVYRVLGDLTVNEGEFRLDNIPSASVQTLDVSFDEEQEAEPKKAQKIILDLKASAPNQLKLVGRGMDAELSMDTTISGTSSEPVIVGNANIVRGQFELLGKRFDFEDSEIEFRGDPLQARLNIVASRETDDFTAIVTITGTPNDPKIALTSDPELPEDEVLSRVLFGRSPSQLTGLEAARLAAAIASLSGGGGFDLMGGIENLVGVDNLDLTQNSDGEFEVTTGRYLNDDIYMEVSSGGTGIPGVSVEWEARDNISVEAETRPDDGQTLSIQWKKDFD